MAANASSPEMKQSFMRLAELYAELAEYSGNPTPGLQLRNEDSKP